MWKTEIPDAKEPIGDETPSGVSMRTAGAVAELHDLAPPPPDGSVTLYRVTFACGSSAPEERAAQADT